MVLFGMVALHVNDLPKGTESNVNIFVDVKFMTEGKNKEDCINWLMSCSMMLFTGSIIKYFIFVVR